MQKLEDVRINAQILPLNALRVDFDRPPAQCKSRREIDWNTRLVLPDGRRMIVSDRFWNSFSSLFSLSRSVFDYFSHAEVFERITQAKGDSVRIACEEMPIAGAEGRLLSCTKPDKPLLRIDQARQLVTDYEGVDMSYAGGIVTARFDCPFPMEFAIAGDDFRTQFHVNMPVDGFGLPSAYLALLRLVCSNGLVGIHSAFKTVFQLGKNDYDLGLVLRRAMDSFNNEEGFHSLRQRVDASSKSWASLREAIGLRKAIERALRAEGRPIDSSAMLLGEFDKLCGNPLAFYGLTAIEELSTRKARSIPVEATVYDLFNFASEASTHHLLEQTARNRVNGWIGESIVVEYDLEGTVDNFPEYRDYFLAHKSGQESPAMNGEARKIEVVSADEQQA